MSDSKLFEAALARLRRGIPAIGSAALTGSVLLTLPAQIACVDATDPTGTIESADWAQYEGIRNTTMVSYTGSWWSDCSANTRFGCGIVAVHLKLKVKPVVNADLNWKRVGVVYHLPDDTTERTALGAYAGTAPDGSEEWQVTVQVSGSQVVLFDAWYQDGAGHTWLDDNQGELHVVNPGPAYQIIRVEPWLNTATVDGTGVHGQLSIQVANLDYDKGIEIVGTTDGWNTIQHFGMGAPGQKNAWYWTESFPYGGRERWKIDLDIPGAASKFEYAVVYRHGVVNGARTTEFWDNNGFANYVITGAINAPVVAAPTTVSLEAAAQ
ncbi:MAG: CBM21 domain-containing protein [Deltaproteobacteria bacterium]|nr:CBM21 domain-containing protein [Deltaproteobacteria bacterium]